MFSSCTSAGGLKMISGQEIIVLREESLAISRCFLKVVPGTAKIGHAGGKDQGRGERQGQGISDHPVVLFEGIFEDVSGRTGKEVPEKTDCLGIDSRMIIAFSIPEILDVGERRAEHGVGRGEAESGGRVEFGNLRFDQKRCRREGTAGEVGRADSNASMVLLRLTALIRISGPKSARSA